MQADGGCVGVSSGLLAYTSGALRKRKLTEETCAKFSYGIGDYKGAPCQVATYFDKHRVPCGQKIRLAGKKFVSVGKMKAAPLFGHQLWSAGGKSITVTEGELDAMSVSQIWDHKFPVVSIPAGAGNARKCFEANLEFLESFEKVVIMFDNDEHGQTAGLECAEVLTPGKAHIATLPLKDASDMLVADRGPEVVNAFWRAKTYRPDGVLVGDDVFDLLVRPLPPSYPYPFAGLNDKLIGARKGEAVVFCAGAGTGKSLIVREITANLLAQGEKVGLIHLEEDVQRSALGVLSVYANRPLHLEPASPDELRKLWDPVKDSLAFYDHWGTIDSAVIIPKIRYMVHALGVQWIVLDHISIMVSGDESDERRNLDIACTRLGMLIRELKIGLFMVCHLKRPDGKPHEDGARIHLGHLRGSAGVGQLADAVVGDERNQQDPTVCNYHQLRIVKSRWIGKLGIAGVLEYSEKTGRLSNTDIDLEALGAFKDEDSDL